MNTKQITRKKAIAATVLVASTIGMLSACAAVPSASDSQRQASSNARADLHAQGLAYVDQLEARSGTGSNAQAALRSADAYVDFLEAKAADAASTVQDIRENADAYVDLLEQRARDNADDL